ncbi:MAG TPA: hypothetical protein VG269_09030, partial [Tepidisphaeraceae bacterium]|nr:hypothetical protein [Tepidisphaeraceae bacterium]
MTLWLPDAPSRKRGRFWWNPRQRAILVRSDMRSDPLGTEQTMAMEKQAYREAMARLGAAV